MTEYPLVLPDAVLSRKDDEDTLDAKLTDVLTPGFLVEFDPVEAEQAGAFSEDALSERDARDSDIDAVDTAAPTAEQ